MPGGAHRVAMVASMAARGPLADQGTTAGHHVSVGTGTARTAGGSSSGSSSTLTVNAYVKL
jgi:hypothetical protein